MAAYYRIGDSLENLKLNIVIREKASTIPKDVIASAETKKKPFSDKKELCWQQKLIGPREINDELRKGNGANADLLKTNMFYTYTDRDNFFPFHRNPIASQDERESYVGAALHGSINSALGAAPSAGGDRRAALVNNRITRQRKKKSMHLCLGTDIEADNIRNQKPWDINFFFTENLLCSLYIYEDGLLEVTPGVSTIVQETPVEVSCNRAVPAPTSSGNYSGGIVGTPDVESSAVSIFLDDTTVKSALKTGFKLSTFSIASRNGTEFEYSIHVANDLLSPLDIEELRKLDAIANTRAAESSRISLRKEDDTWKQDPPAKSFDRTITCNAEIVSASGFESSKLFINYQILVPQTWSLRTGNVVDGIAEADVLAATKTGTANDREKFANALDNDGFEDGTEAQGVLQGTTQTAIANEWRMGHPHCINRPRRRWTTIPFAFDKGTRIIIGISFYVITVIAIILGCEYPFWLVPSIVIALVVGTGYPAGGPTQLLLVAQSNSKGMLQTAANNRQPTCQEGVRRGSSKYAGPGSNKTCYPLVTSPVAHFNYLLSASFDARDYDIQKQTIAPSSNVPTLLFQVYGVGLMGRQVLEGYGYAHLPETPGEAAMEIKTWKPLGWLDPAANITSKQIEVNYSVSMCVWVGGIEAKMKEYFLGSASRLRDDLFVEITNKSATSLNRFGIQTGSSGSIYFKCHTIVSDPRKKNIHANHVDTPLLPQERRTVEDILHKFKNTMLLSRSMNASGGSLLSTSASKQSLATRLTGSDSQSRTSDALGDVLARAKAKTAGKVGSNPSPQPSPILTSSSNNGQMSPSLNSIAKDMKSSLNPSDTISGASGRPSSRDRRSTRNATSENDDTTLMGTLNPNNSRSGGREDDAMSASDGIGARMKKPIAPASRAGSASSSGTLGDASLPPLRGGRGASGGVSTGEAGTPTLGRIRGATTGARNRYDNANIDTDGDDEPHEQQSLLKQ